tara:strand:- start:4478 stop:4792 length:315 start_codon:yes stop_codon:yes gene_type:complete
MAGAPNGNSNASTGRQGRHALVMALENYDKTKEDPYEDLKVIGSVKTLILMWKPIIEKAFEEGDLAALKEINDRLDGKPMQSLEHSGSIAQLTHEQWLDTLNDE